MWPLIISVLVIILGVLFLRKKMNYFKDLGIPHVPPLPVFGNMATILFRTRHRLSVVQDSYDVDKDAKYVGIYDFMSPTFLIRDPDLIKNIAVKNFDHFTDHQTIVTEVQDPLFGKNIFSLTGERWKNVRNILSPAFTSSKMKIMFELFVKCAENFSEHLREQAEKNNVNIVQMKDAFTRYTNDVIATCAFGVDIDSMKNPDNEFYTFGKIATTLDNLLFKVFMLRAFPAIAKQFDIKLMPHNVRHFFTNLIQNIIATRDEKGITRPDMIQLMMDARHDTNNKVKLDIDEMTAQAFLFFFGGFDTTSTSMGFIAHELAVNPDIQERLQQDIDDIMADTNGKPSYEHINNMPYLDAVFHETLRLHPLADVLDRCCTKSFELPPALPGLKPVTLTPGMKVWFAAAAIHGDPNYFENPTVFDPERFLSKKSTTTQTTYLGFGLGPRMCIGNRFAILETKVMLFYLLAKCTLVPSSRTKNPIELDPKYLNMTVKGGFWLEIKPRKSSLKSL